MSLFDFLKSKPKIGGQIAFFGLTDWWLNEFNEDERKHILKIFQPLGGSSKSLIEGEIAFTGQTAVGLLSALAGWFKKEEDRTIAYRMLSKAEELISDTKDILDIHFFYQSKLEIYYRHRNNDPDALDNAIEACKQQIQMAHQAEKAFKDEYKNEPLPLHKGYEQLAIILEKQEKFDEAIALCKEVVEQGWNGSWKKRIERCRKKKEKV